MSTEHLVTDPKSDDSNWCRCSNDGARVPNNDPEISQHPEEGNAYDSQLHGNVINIKRFIDRRESYVYIKGMDHSVKIQRVMKENVNINEIIF